MKAFESDIFASSSMLGERWKLAKSQHDRIHMPPEVSSNSQKYTPKSRFSQENGRIISSDLRKKENADREAKIILILLSVSFQTQSDFFYKLEIDKSQFLNKRVHKE